MQKGERWGEVRLDVAGWTPHPKPGWLARVLGQIPLFGGLSKDDLRVVADLVQLRHYVTGVSVVRAGARGDSLHIILEGRAAVRPEVGDDRSLAPGDFFGELALLDGGPRAATVVATEGLSTARLPAPAFRKLLSEEPAIAVGLLPGLVHVVRDLQTPLPKSDSVAALEPLDGGSLGNTRDLLAWQMALRHAPLLSSLPDRHLRRVVQRFRVRRGAAGSELVRMGARGTSFFVVLDGTSWWNPRTGLASRSKRVRVRRACPHRRRSAGRDRHRPRRRDRGGTPAARLRETAAQ